MGSGQNKVKLLKTCILLNNTTLFFLFMYYKGYSIKTKY